MVHFLMLEALNQYKSLLLVIMSVIYAVATLVLWYFSHRSSQLSRLSLEEMKKSHEEEIRPYLGIHPEINSQGWFLLTLKNFGKTAAFEVKLHFAKDYIARKDDKETLLINDLGICVRIAFFAPSTSISEILNFESHRFWSLNEGQQSLKGTLIYQDSKGKIYQEHLDYDLTPLFQRKYITYPDLQSSLKNLQGSCQKLNRQLEQLTY